MARTLLLKKLTKLLKVAVLQQRHRLPDEYLQPSSRHDFNRRDFLQSSLIGIGIGIPGLLWAEQHQLPKRLALGDKSSSQSQAITVVGAGTAGLSAAYYLAKAGHSSHLYEASNRLGGRMFTMPNFNAEGMFCELGGEFVDTQHEDLISLCLELGLSIENLAANDQSPLREIYFSHEKIRTEAQVLAAFKPLARRLVADIKALSPKGELKVPTYNSELAQSPRVQALDRMSLNQYLEESGIDAWLRDLISNAYVGEYGLEATDQSALNLIVLISADTAAGFKIYGSSDEAKRIAGGSAQLPRALAKALHSNCPIEYGHRLLAIKDSGQNLVLSFDAQGKTVEVRTHKLILAMPVSLLKEVDMSSLDLSPVKRRAMSEWGFGTNSKFMQGFQKRVWEKPGVPRGFSIAPDTLVQEFWDTSRGQQGKSGIITSFLGGKLGQTIDPRLGPKTLSFLDKILPGAQAAFDGKSILQHWPSQIFARGSYTCTKPGQYTSIYGCFAEPELQGRLLFAGEHCSSEWSGFMNGAVQSGRQAAESLLKL